MDKLKWYGKHFELSHLQLWCMHGFLVNIYIFHQCTLLITYLIFYKSNNWLIRMVNQLGHTKWPLIWNLQYQTYVFHFFLCDVQKATAHVDKKSLNMYHQSQKSFRGTLFGITSLQKGYTLYTYLVHGK